jgi:hypothetical protein
VAVEAVVGVAVTVAVAVAGVQALINQTML